MTLFRSLVTFIASRRSRLGRVVPDEHVSRREQKSSTVFYGSYNNTPSGSNFLYSPIQNPCHFLVILVPPFPVSVSFYASLGIFVIMTQNNQSLTQNFQNLITMTKIRKIMKFEKIDKLMARCALSLHSVSLVHFTRGGFVWESTGIFIQKVYYYNYSDTVIY